MQRVELESTARVVLAHEVAQPGSQNIREGQFPELQVPGPRCLPPHAAPQGRSLRRPPLAVTRRPPWPTPFASRVRRYQRTRRLHQPTPAALAMEPILAHEGGTTCVRGDDEARDDDGSAKGGEGGAQPRTTPRDVPSPSRLHPAEAVPRRPQQARIATDYITTSRPPTCGHQHPNARIRRTGSRTDTSHHGPEDALSGRQTRRDLIDVAEQFC